MFLDVDRDYNKAFELGRSPWFSFKYGDILFLLLFFFLITKKQENQLLSSVWLFATPWTVAYQAPLSIEFARQEYWSGFAISHSRESSQPREQTHASSVAGRSLPSESSEKPWVFYCERRMGCREENSRLRVQFRRNHELLSFSAAESTCGKQVAP